MPLRESTESYSGAAAVDRYYDKGLRPYDTHPHRVLTFGGDEGHTARLPESLPRDEEPQTHGRVATEGSPAQAGWKDSSQVPKRLTLESARTFLQHRLREARNSNSRKVLEGLKVVQERFGR
jgi:hypothetical protein